MSKYRNNKNDAPTTSEKRSAVLEFILSKNGKPLSYCIDIVNVVEIAEFPKVISKVSSQDDFVYGIINIRKDIFIPLYNIAYRLNLDYKIDTSTAKVVVLFLDESFIAVLVNSVHRIHNILDSKIMRSNTYTDSAVPCTSGYFKTKTNIVQILDLEKLLDYSFTPPWQRSETHLAPHQNINPPLNAVTTSSILVVSNTPITSKYLQDALSSISSTVSTYSSNAEAVAAMDSILQEKNTSDNLPSLIVCNAHSEGNKLVHEIRQNPAYTMPIIMISPPKQSEEETDLFKSNISHITKVGSVVVLHKPKVSEIVDSAKSMLVGSHILDNRLNTDPVLKIETETLPIQGGK